MPGKAPVYKARFRKNSDGAVKASYKKIREEEAKPSGKTAARRNPIFDAEEQVTKARESVRTTAAARLKAPKDEPAKRTRQTAAAKKAAQPDGGKAAGNRTAPKRAAAGTTAAKKQTVSRENIKKPAGKKETPVSPVYKDEGAKKRPQKAPAGRAAAKKKTASLTRGEKKQMAVFRDRKRAVSRRPGPEVTLIALLTAVFECLGLLLGAANTQGGADTQTLMLLCGVVPLGLATSLLLPRVMPIDALVMALTNFLCGLGVVILYTVSPDRGVRQAMFYGVGTLAMIVVAAAVPRIRRWRGLTAVSMLLGIGALLLPLAFGEWQGGAKNWVSVPFFGSFQPSELVKLAIILAIAYSFSAHRTVLQMMPAILFAGACLALLMFQRDLGTALIYYMTTLVLFYVACGNVPLTILGLGGGAGAAVMGYRMFAHVKVRVAMWRNPWSDPLDKGYQIIQALLAIGSGGLFGVGLGQGTPDMIPAYYNDCIFAVICEQMGLVFGLLVLAVYVMLILRGGTIIARTRRSFDMLLGCGVLAMLAIQTLMIVGGVIKMIPLTGVTMPFLSYGGSSLLSCMAMIGVLHGISARAQEDLEEDILGA
ncbi:MAG: FtsW/RodA/SpoVE family cell cycle protein [Clostridia bacterium]|nr:FtsW/RodA/SpoVE family cell cycle protein [Clostridia bacterium]